MAIYTGIDCPVCGKKFEDGEDIVTCPVCGTPSHRECYQKNRGCINFDKHSDGFEFKVKKENPEQQVDKIPFLSPEVSDDESAHATVAVPAMDSPNVSIEDIRIELGDTIGGENSKEVASVVKKNTPFYVRKFEKLERKKSKITWNLPAILFGPYWFFYRRMSKVGSFVLGLEIVAHAFITVIFRDSFVKISSVMMEITTQISQNGGATTAEMMDKLVDTAKSTQIITAWLINFGIVALIRIVSGLLANNLYKNHCVKIVKLAKQNVSTPELAVKLQSIGYDVKSKRDILSIYLSQMGGTSFLGVLTGYLGYMLVSQLVATFL